MLIVLNPSAAIVDGLTTVENITFCFIVAPLNKYECWDRVMSTIVIVVWFNEDLSLYNFGLATLWTYDSITMVLVSFI